MSFKNGGYSNGLGRPRAKRLFAPARGSVWQPATHYKRKPGTWWKGRRVKLEREIRTLGGDVFRKGRIVKVARKYRGLSLEAKNLYVTRVGFHGLSVDATPND